jgi:hypothetical protein
MTVEYKVLSNAIADIFHLQKLFTYLDATQYKSTPLYNNNQSCIQLIKNLLMHEKTKLINIITHFIIKKIN